MKLKNLEGIAREIEKELSEKEELREKALIISREIIKNCGEVIRGLHKGEDVEKNLLKAKRGAKKFSKLLKRHEDIFYSGYVENAFIELSEACVLYSLFKNKKIPSPIELNITNTSYLLGLGDLIGELRRNCLEHLRRGELKKAEETLKIMEEIFSILIKFDYPNAIVSIRRRQDIARRLIEKTRAEVVLSIRTYSLEKKLRNYSKL